jgi:hypothetical protein
MESCAQSHGRICSALGLPRRFNWRRLRVDSARQDSEASDLVMVLTARAPDRRGSLVVLSYPAIDRCCHRCSFGGCVRQPVAVKSPRQRDRKARPNPDTSRNYHSQLTEP